MSTAPRNNQPRRILAIRFLTAAVCALAIPAHSAAEGDALKRLLLKFEVEKESLDAPRKKLDEQYRARLHSLIAESTERGSLNEVLQVKRILDGGNYGEASDATSFGALSKAQEIYLERRDALGATKEEQLELLNRSKRAALESLVSTLTRSRKITEASEVQNELDTLAKELGKTGPVDASDWSLLGKAKAKGGDDDFGVTGETGGRVRYLTERLPANCTITGDYKGTGNYFGFVIGLNPEDNHYLSIYSRIEHVKKGKRKEVAPSKVEWTRDSWTAFRIDRSRGEWTISMNGAETSYKIPDEYQAGQFGMIAYWGSSFVLRDVEIRVR